MSVKAIKKNAKTTAWLYDMFTEEEHIEQRCIAQISTSIQRRRKAKGYTQKDLGKKLGVSQVMVSRWENGEENFTIATLAKISKVLELELSNPLENQEKLLRVAEDSSPEYSSSKI